jgi:hypothetical protein
MLAVLLTACTSSKRIEQAAKPAPAESSSAAGPDPAPQADPSDTPHVAPAAGAIAENTLPPLQKDAKERFDCLTGTPLWHARIAFEAEGGQVLGFAYYSKWGPRTCSIEFMRNAAGGKWHTGADGVVHVNTPQGQFHIRTSAEAYVFEFAQVKRQKFCGMPGEINGRMTIQRNPGPPQCSATGIMDTNDPYLDSLYKRKR